MRQPNAAGLSLRAARGIPFTNGRAVSQFDGGGAFVWSIRQHWGHRQTFFMSVPTPSPKPDRCRSYTICTSQIGHFGVAALAFLGK